METRDCGGKKAVDTGWKPVIRGCVSIFVLALVLMGMMGCKQANKAAGPATVGTTQEARAEKKGWFEKREKVDESLLDVKAKGAATKAAVAEKKKGWFDDWGKKKQGKVDESLLDVKGGTAKAGGGKRSSKDPAPTPLYAVQLEVFQLDVPAGAVSGNSEFWKRITEEGVEVAARENLMRNGFRVGLGAVADWDAFKQILDQYPVRTVRTSMLAYQVKQVDLLTRKNQPGRNLFVFDAAGQPVGKSYDPADYLMTLSLWPTPRKNGEVHVKLVPLVRSGEKHIERYVGEDQRADFRYVRPEWIYDVKMESDVPLEDFLVVAPMADAVKGTTSLGHAFLVSDDPGDRVETVLIMVARPVGAAGLPTGGQGEKR